MSNPSCDQSSPCPRVNRVERNPAGQLVVHIEGRGEPVVDATVARCFPWSVPEQFICLREKGKEVAMLKSLDELDEPSRKIVQEELWDKVFNPRIHRVLDFKSEFDVTYITAQTDRGEVTFQIRSRDDIRLLSAKRALFRDVDGNCYELADFDQLDSASRKHLKQYF